MYKVLLADDEPYALVVLRKIIVWEEHGFCIVGTAEDGVSALKMAHDLKPDVVFTDIRMPRTNGLELITELHKLNEKMLIVCVSGYNEFTYVQQGLRLGVSDYLLKPVKRDDLIRLLNKMSHQLDQEHNNSHYINALFSLLSGQNMQSIQSSMSLLGIREQHAYVAFITHILSEHRNIPLFTVISEEGLFSHVCFRTGSMQETFLLFSDTDHENAAKWIAQQDWPEKDRTGYCCFSSIKEPFSARFSQSEIAARTNCLRQDSQPLPYHPQRQPKQENQLLRRFSTALNTINQKELHLVFRDLIIYSQTLMLDEIASLYNNLVLTVKSAHKDFENALDYQNYAQLGQQYTSIPDIFTSMEKILTANEQNSSVPNASTISLILRAIDTQYTSEIEFTTLAEQFHITPNYLSILIKKETGITFTELIIKKRMDAACRLLRETTLPIQNIVEQIGYSEYSYFNRLFKKRMEMTPNQYRKQFQSVKEQASQ